VHSAFNIRSRSQTWNFLTRRRLACCNIDIASHFWGLPIHVLLRLTRQFLSHSLETRGASGAQAIRGSRLVPETLLETMPLRDRIREAERLSRELAQHLELDFLTKVHSVRSTTRTDRHGHQHEHVADNTVRTAVDAVLNSHEYTMELTRKLERFLNSINREMHALVSGPSAKNS